MKTLTLSFEELTNLWWFLKEVARNCTVEDYPSLFGVLHLVEEQYQTYRLPLPDDALLNDFIDECLNILRDKSPQSKKERIAIVKSVHPIQTKQLSSYYNDLRHRQAQSSTIHFEPLTLKDLPQDVAEDHLEMIKPLMSK